MTQPQPTVRRGLCFAPGNRPRGFIHLRPIVAQGAGIIAQTPEPTNQTQRAAAARQFAIDAARLAANTRCHSVTVLDVSGLSPVTDYFVIATGTSPRQMRTVADEIGELGEKHNFAPLTIGGYEGETWVLLDCIDVVVHLFNGEARQYYDLDGLWGDAKRVEWGEQRAPGYAPNHI